MEIVAMIFIFFVAVAAGMISMIPGAIGVGIVRFWQVWTYRKFNNHSRVYLARLAKTIARNEKRSRIAFWVLRFLRGFLLFLLSLGHMIVFAIVGLGIGFVYGFVWTLFKISALINNYGEEADAV